MLLSIWLVVGSSVPNMPRDEANRFSGNTDAYCGTGCVAGCSASATFNPPPIITSLVGAFPTSNVIHLISSTSVGEPILGQAMSSVSAAAPEATGLVTTDGTCGTTYGGTVCGDWIKGSCCSMYGWCGNT